MGQRQRAPAADAATGRHPGGADLPRGRPGVGRRGRGAAGGDPGPPARAGPAHRGGRPGHQPGRHPRAVQLELAYLNAANDLCRMVCEGTFPPSGPRRGAHRPAGRRRADPAGRRRAVVYASPNAQSAYRRLGVTGDLLDGGAGADDPGAVPGPVRGQRRRRPDQGGAGRGDAGPDGARGARGDRAVPGAAAASRGHGRGRAGAGPRRDRGAQPGPAAAQQGRHDPGDPPPGEEQPADRRGAAAAAGAAGRSRRTRGPRWRSRCAGSRPSRWCTRRCRCRWTSGSTSTGSWTGCCDRSATCAAAGTRVRLERTGSLRDPGRRHGDAAGRWCSTELVQNALEHAFGRRTRRRDGHGDRVRLGRRMSVVVADDGTGLPDGVRPRTSDRLGLQIVRTLVTAELGGSSRSALGPARGGTERRPRRPAHPPPQLSPRTGRVEPGPRSAAVRGAVPAERGTARRVSAGPSETAGQSCMRAPRGPSPATLEGAALVLAHPTPNSGVLSGLKRPAQARHRSPGSAGTRPWPRSICTIAGTGVADREEQLRVLVAAERAVAPVHCVTLLASHDGCDPYPQPRRTNQTPLVNHFTSGGGVKTGLGHHVIPASDRHPACGDPE